MAAADDSKRSEVTSAKPHRYRHPVNRKLIEEASIGERLADRIAGGIGSWRFLIIQTFLVALWVAFNLLGLFAFHWDPYPFVLLNLMFSVQAAYTGPVLLLAGNRQSQKDRMTLEHASDEAERGDQATQRILLEIRQNTELTVQILRYIEGQPGAAPAGREPKSGETARISTPPKEPRPET